VDHFLHNPIHSETSVTTIVNTTRCLNRTSFHRVENNIEETIQSITSPLFCRLPASVILEHVPSILLSPQNRRLVPDYGLLRRLGAARWRRHMGRRQLHPQRDSTCGGWTTPKIRVQCDVANKIAIPTTNQPGRDGGGGFGCKSIFIEKKSRASWAGILRGNDEENVRGGMEIVGSWWDRAQNSAGRIWWRARLIAKDVVRRNRNS
jgi:hypothetical protein